MRGTGRAARRSIGPGFEPRPSPARRCGSREGPLRGAVSIRARSLAAGRLPRGAAGFNGRRAAPRRRPSLPALARCRNGVRPRRRPRPERPLAGVLTLGVARPVAGGQRPAACPGPGFCRGRCPLFFRARMSFRGAPPDPELPRRDFFRCLRSAGSEPDGARG